MGAVKLLVAHIRVNRYSATVSRNALIEFHRHKTKENLWPTLRINTRKTCPVSFTAMTSALTATCAGKPHPLISRAATTAATPMYFKQPTTPEEALCKEAMEGCPVEAIGNNGED